MLNRRPIGCFGKSKISSSSPSAPPPPALAYMPSEKRSRKRQKAGKHSTFKSRSKSKPAALDDNGDFEPLGSGKRVWEDEEKDDEERRLESALFGRPYVPVRTGDESDEEDEGMLEADLDLAGNEFANLLDSEVRRTHVFT